MKESLTIEMAIANKMTWIDCIRYYKPDATDEECDDILWNQTCFPFDAETTLKQLHQLLSSEPNDAVCDATDDAQ